MTNFSKNETQKSEQKIVKNQLLMFKQQYNVLCEKGINQLTKPNRIFWNLLIKHNSVNRKENFLFDLLFVL